MSDPRLPFELGIVPLGNRAFEGRNNCYVLGTEPTGTTTLVDTGISSDRTRSDLASGLDAHGIGFEDVEQILLTHFHADHAGLAGEIQSIADCPVYAHELDAALVTQTPEAISEKENSLRRCIDEWGMPDEKQDELLSFLESTDNDGIGADVTPFTGGDRFDLGSVDLEAVHMPGHTDGLTGFAFDGRDGEEVFSGDALLPYYTPNVGGADTRVEGALGKYLETLSAIVDRGYTRAWPGHRGPIIDPPGRAADIIVHHRERTERVIDVLRDGPATAWEVSAALFGSLSTIHIMHGPGEAFSHLDHLEDAGIVRLDGRVYELLDDDPELDGLFPDVSDVIDPENQPGV